MLRQLQSLLGRAREVIAWCRAHPPTDPGTEALVKPLEDSLTKAEDAATRQRDGLLIARKGMALRPVLVREITMELLPHLVSVAEHAAPEKPKELAIFRRLRGVGYEKFGAAVRSMLAAAKANLELLGKHGLQTQVVADLESALAAVDAVSGNVFEARRLHVAATKELQQLAREIRRLIRMLDAAYRYQFAKAPEQLRAWRSAAGVVRQRRTGTPPPSGSGEGRVA